MAWLQLPPRPAAIRTAVAALAVLAVLARPAAVEAAPPQGPGSSAPGAGTPVPREQGVKGAHSVFRPTPRESLREMSTDRPDQTESPYTVDAGHVQLEMDFLTATIDRNPAGHARVASWSLAPVNLKLGLLNDVDVQIVVSPYERSRGDDGVAGQARTASGFGNVATRVKVNFWGNDGGRTAFGMMVFVKWPLPASGLRNGRAEGGLILPFAVSIAEGWDMGAMAELDVVAGPAGGYDAQLVNSVTIGRAVTERLGMYVEVLAAGLLRKGSRWMGQLDIGWTYALRDTVQVDFGSNIGVAGSAPAIQPFAGLSLRF